MLDINLLRHNPGVVRESQRRRFKPVQLVDEVIDLDTQLLAAEQSLELLNETLKTDGTLRVEDMGNLKAEIARLKGERDCKLSQIGNIVHDSVPVFVSKKGNVVVQTWGSCRSKDGVKGHSKLVKLLDIADTTAGNVVAGGRGYYLKGDGVLLNMALINYGLLFLRSRGYSPLMPPFFMRKSLMVNSSHLHKDLYKIGDSEDTYLIGTSEQPLSAFNSGRALYNLPIRYAGYSTCFRREAKAHCTKDASSIYRVNQFEKVEQFCITSPLGDESWNMLEEMIKVSQEFYQELGLPYRVVSEASGALNASAAKQYDLQGWFPECGRYRELVSCSNCTDYQSKELQIQYMQTDRFVHMLNSTLTATERTMCCVLENYQSEYGVSIPKVLQPFMMGTDFLPFKQESL